MFHFLLVLEHELAYISIHFDYLLLWTLIFRFKKLDLFIFLEQGCLETFVFISKALFLFFILYSELLEGMLEKSMLAVKLFFSLLVAPGDGFEFIHELIIELFHFIVFLVRDCFFWAELTMEIGIGLFEFSNGLLKVDIFGLDVVVLLFEDWGLLMGEGQGLAFEFKVVDCF